MMYLVVLAVFGLTLAFGVHAEVGQQSQFDTCNREGIGKKGLERDAFMKTCMSEGQMQEQERMKAQRQALRQKWR